jgi:hypothetical protein
MRCRTPLTPTGVLDVTVGLVTVTVDDQGIPAFAVDPVESATALDAFTAFDPTSVLGGTRGGPIEGAVYVTALDAITGLPVPNMLAFTGSGGAPTAADITHFPFGQATLSGPDIFGPQTVSIVGDGYEYSSLVDVNASAITLYLQPLGGGGGAVHQGGVAAGGGPGPALLRRGPALACPGGGVHLGNPGSGAGSAAGAGRLAAFPGVFGRSGPQVGGAG